MDNDKESALPASSSISTVQLEHADEKDMSGNHMDITLPLIPPLQARLFEYRGEHVAGFEIPPQRCLVCLPQLYELFLKGFVGGLHTVYTKLKRLGIQPLVCNVEQVRALRRLGAIQPGVNRCKLIDMEDFEVLFQDCTNVGFVHIISTIYPLPSSSRPGRPPKRTPSGTVQQLSDEWTAQPQIASSSLHDEGSGTVSAGCTPASSAISIFPNSSALLSPSLLGAAQEQMAATSLGNSADAFAFAIAQAQQLAGNSQFLSQQLLLHHMAIAAASMAAMQQKTKHEDGGQQQQQQQQQQTGNEKGVDDGTFGEQQMVSEQGRDAEEREHSMDTLNGEDRCRQFSSGASSVSTTMHGDLVMPGQMEAKRREKPSAKGDNSLKLLSTHGFGPSDMMPNSHSFSSGSNSNLDSSNGKPSNERQSLMSTSADEASPGISGDSSSGSASSRSNRRGGGSEAEVQCLLDRLNSVAERVENALKGHCQQLNELSAAMRTQMEAAKASEARARLERRKSEMFFQRYFRLKRHSQCSAPNKRCQQSQDQSRNHPQSGITK